MLYIYMFQHIPPSPATVPFVTGAGVAKEPQHHLNESTKVSRLALGHLGPGQQLPDGFWWTMI